MELVKCHVMPLQMACMGKQCFMVRASIFFICGKEVFGPRSVGTF